MNDDSSSSGVPPAMLKLMLDEKTQEHRLTSRVTRIGRASDMDIVVPESIAGVSRHHATIFAEGDQWFISDQQSRNGTFVNQRLAERTPLTHGDEIYFGPVRCLFQSCDPVERHSGTVVDTATTGPPTDRMMDFPSIGSGERVSYSIDVASLHSQVDRTPSVMAGRSTETSLLVAADRAWAMRFFSEIGRALLVSANLDEMLENVMIESFVRVPAQRGVICLRDSKAGELQPRVIRSDEGDSPIRSSRTIIEACLASQAALLVEDTSSDQRFAEAASIKQQSIASAICVPLYHDGQVHGVIYLDSLDAARKFTSDHLEVLTALGLFSAVAIQQTALRDQALEEQRKRERLARYSSPAVIDRVIAAQEEDVSMLADRAEVSVLFADLKGFTSMSERKTPEEVVAILNEVFSHFTKIVFENNGTLDKFMGDGMLAFFGAPLALEDHAVCAVRAALKMQSAISDFNARHAQEEPVGLRIGINTGPVIVGDIGSEERKDFTVIGDTVNLASRLESSVAQVGEVIIGQSTFESLGNEIQCEALAPTMVKGKKAPIRAYRVVVSR